MQNPFRIGDIKSHAFVVRESDFASFKNGIVHPVCSTFALGREMEWSSRLFVLDMIESHEEGVGTMLEIQHLGPALADEEVSLEARFESFENHELICSIKVTVGNRMVAKGKTGQKILSKERINQIFTSLGK